MSSAQIPEPLRIAADPFAAGTAGRHVGRPLQAAFDELTRQIALQTPLVLVTGGASTGKTSLAEMTERACSEMDLSVRRVDHGDLVHLALGRRCDVLLVDEANSLTDSLLEALLPRGGGKTATTTVFLGLPLLAGRFAFSDVRPVIIELAPLSPSDARGYLLERATVAGLTDLFTTEALDLIIDGALGSPRLLRSIASLAFFGAASAGAAQITLRHATSALAAQGRSGAQKPNVSPLRLQVADETLVRDRRAVQSPSRPQTPAEIVAGLTSAAVAVAQDREVAESPSQIQMPTEIVAEPARADTKADEDHETVALGLNQARRDEFAYEDAIVEDEAAVESPVQRETPAEIAYADLTQAEGQKTFESLSQTEKPAETVDSFAGMVSKATDDHETVASPSDSLDPAGNLGEFVQNNATMIGNERAAEAPLHTRKPSKLIVELAYRGRPPAEHPRTSDFQAPAEQPRIEVSADVQAMAESVGKRPSETRTEPRSHAWRRLSIGATDRKRLVAGICVVIAAAVLVAFMPSILAGTASRLNSTPAASLPASGLAVSTHSGEAAGTVQGVPALREAEIPVPPAQRPDAVEAVKAVPKAAAARRVTRPLTAEEKAAVVRGLQELGLRELEARATRVDPSDYQP